MDVVLWNAALFHGLDDRGDRPGRIHRHQDHISPRFQGQNGRFQCAVVLGNGLHHQGIGHNHPLEAPLLPQNPRQDGVGEGGGAIEIEAGDLEVGGHNAGNPSGDRPPKGHPFQGLQTIAAVGQFRQFQVGVDRRVAMARKMLSRGQNPLTLATLNKGGNQVRHNLRRFPKGPHINDRVLGIVIDIGDGGQHPVQTQGDGFLGREPTEAAGVVLGKGQIPAGDRPQSQGRRHPTGPRKALPHPLFNISSQQQRNFGPLLQLLGPQRQFWPTAPQQNHPPNAQIGNPVAQGCGGGFPLGIANLGVEPMARGPHHHQLRHLLGKAEVAPVGQNRFPNHRDFRLL